MTYRLLKPEEWPRVLEFMPLDLVPEPRLSEICVAETEQGEIAGFLIAQAVVHLEPIFIRPEFKHAVRFNKLVEKLESVVGRNYYCFSESSLVERMLKFVGFLKLPYKVWKRK